MSAKIIASICFFLNLYNKSRLLKQVSTTDKGIAINLQNLNSYDTIIIEAINERN